MTSFKTVFLFLTLCIIGFLLLPLLPVQLLADAEMSKAIISYSVENATSEITEEEATAPLENALSQLANIKRIYSESTLGNGFIEITFDPQTDMDFKRFEIASIIKRLYPKLHGQITYPTIDVRGSENQNRSSLLTYHVSGNVSLSQIKQTLAKTFIPRLSQIKGVKEITVNGAGDPEMVISFNSEELGKYGLTLADIQAAIETQTKVDFPGSAILSSGQRVTIQTGTQLLKLEDIKNVQLWLPTGNVISLNQLASVFIETRKSKPLFHINGCNSVTMNIYADYHVNRLLTANKLKGLIESLRKQLPPGLKIQMASDETGSLTLEIRKTLWRSAVSFIAVLLLIKICYGRIISVLLFLSNILVSVGLTFLVSYFLNVTIQLYTIAGLNVAFILLTNTTLSLLSMAFCNSEMFLLIF